MQHNFSQESGVPPKFRTAILVTRQVVVAKAKFLARFTISVRGGIGMRLDNLVNRFLGRSIDNRPIVFDPEIKFMGDELNGIEPTDDGDYELGCLAEV